MKATTTFLIMGLVVLLVFTHATNGDICSCQCCKGNQCKPTDQGSFTTATCSDTDCNGDKCIAKYPGACPPDGQPGAKVAICISGGISSQHRINAISVSALLSAIWVFKQYF